MKRWHFELNDHEDLIFDQRLHWWYFAPLLVYEVVLLVLTYIGVSVFAKLPWWLILLPASIFVVLTLRLVYRWGRYRSSHLILTTDRLVDASGVIGRRVREFPVRQISNLDSSQSLFERIAGFGSVAVESPGEGSLERLVYVRKPERVKNLISAQISRLNTRNVGGSSPRSAVDELTKLADLRRDGSISQQEYDLAKQKLLNQI